MSTPEYYKNGEKSIQILTHALRVWPSIVSSLLENDIYIVGMRWDSVDNIADIHVHNIPQLQAWALLRVVHPRLVENGEIYPWKVIYTVDGVNVFALLTAEEKERYYPG